ncbi:MAG: OmpA family protein [Bacteroidales bacterium]|nr:OmpA family protein [Bacteroidales bacterium]
MLAQDEDVLRENFIEAEYHYLYEEFDDALDLYLENYKYDSTNSNLNYRIGQSILHLTDNNRFKREDAILFLERATENMTDQYNEGSFKENKAPYEALFYLGNAHRYNHEFDKAVVVYERFISYLPPTDYFYIDFVKRESQACHNAKELISVPVGFEIESLNDIVNSDAKVENCPVVNYEEDVIVYTSGKNNTFSPDINMAAMNVDYKMDNIYFTHFTDTGWTQPIIINEEIKAGKHAVPTSITGDGKTLYVVRDDNDNGNIYVTSYERDKWTKMRKLNKNINSSNWESHASITEDGKTLFFTSDRPGGYGGLDVYKSEFDEEAQDWGPAINLGPTINSIYDEETPYVVNNGKVLYFSSQGHYGMGGFDIFYSSLLDNGNWTSPMNLGYPLNTVGNDLFYLPRRNGEYAIFPLNNNDRGTMQTNDIFRIKVPTPGTDSTEIEFKGIMGIEDNNWPLYSGAKITIINNDNGDTLNFVNVNLDNGAYKTVISAGSFKVNYFAPGYEPRTEYVLIPKIFAKTEFTLNVTLKPIAVSKGQYYVIKNVFFDYGKSDLTKEAQIEIEKLHDIMTENTDLYIEVIGYTDAVSNAEFNQKLSERRAKSVVDYLITKGISSQRFVAVGKGESNPIAINNNPDGSDNPEGRQLNRRVEIKLMNYNGDRIVVEEIKVPKKLKYQNQASSLLWIVADQALTKQELESKLPSTVDVEKLKSVLQKQEEDKYYFYLTGYPSKADALKDLNALVDAGFKNAQIVEKTSTDEIIAKPEIESGEFTIQIKALRQKVEPSTFTKLSNVEVYKGKDGFYRYVYGSYATRQEALDAKKSIGDEQELKDAFIILVKNLKKY